jgi:prepilin-type N-terminal cleavage/methylation domain-containing protein
MRATTSRGSAGRYGFCRGGRTAFTLVEVLVALGLLGLLALAAGYLGRTMRESGARTHRLYQLLDARSVHDWMEQDLKTAVSIQEPASFGEGGKLVFENRRAERVQYFARPQLTGLTGPGPRVELVRLAESSGDGRREEHVVSGNLSSVVFYQLGGRMAGYYLRYAKTDERDTATSEMVFTSSVAIGNSPY